MNNILANRNMPLCSLLSEVPFTIRALDLRVHGSPHHQTPSLRLLLGGHIVFKVVGNGFLKIVSWKIYKKKDYFSCRRYVVFPFLVVLRCSLLAGSGKRFLMGFSVWGMRWLIGRGCRAVMRWRFFHLEYATFLSSSTSPPSPSSESYS